MIFDRTKNDVDAAIKMRDKKIKAFAELTEEDVAILERGMMTVNTINRIEQKQSQLKEIINGMGYWNTDISNKNWGYEGIFDVTEFQRVLENTEKLRSAFIVYSQTPKVPKVSYHYEDINAIEKILYDISSMADEIKSNYNECGNFICGEV